MTDDSEPTAATELVAEATRVTVEELCEACGVTTEDIVTYVSESIIQPLEPEDRRWIFSHTSVIAVRRAKRLQTDLGLNAAGIALAFDLMAEIDTLKQRLSRYEMRTGTQRREI